jgi:hypothetical protein
VPPQARRAKAFFIVPAAGCALQRCGTYDSIHRQTEVACMPSLSSTPLSPGPAGISCGTAMRSVHRCMRRRPQEASHLYRCLIPQLHVEDLRLGADRSVPPSGLCVTPLGRRDALADTGGAVCASVRPPTAYMHHLLLESCPYSCACSRCRRTTMYRLRRYAGDPRLARPARSSYDGSARTAASLLRPCFADLRLDGGEAPCLYESIADQRATRSTRSRRQRFARSLSISV